MDDIHNFNLSQLKDYKDLLEIRIEELRRHQVDDDYFPPYTEKEIKELKNHEAKANKALRIVKQMIRKKLDAFIGDIEVE